MTGDEKVKKNNDPIFMVCLAIFLIAAIGILGVYVNDHFIEKDDTTAAMGDKVTVNYTGSYYDYVDGEFAVVFDTSYSSVADNDEIVKSGSFTKKSSYTALSFTVGKGDVLEIFGNSVIGHKVGDKIQVMVPAGEGYIGPESKHLDNDMGIVETQEKMSKTNFERLYEDVRIADGHTVFKSVYGWDAQAVVVDGTDVLVTYFPEDGKTYDYAGNEDSKFGTVKFKVYSTTEDFVSFEYIVDGKKTGGENGEIQMINLDFGNEVFHITHVDSDGFTYQSGIVEGKHITGENTNMPLYFEIEIVEIGA